MAIIKADELKRLDLPHEPGQWIEVRIMTAGDIDKYSRDGGFSTVHLLKLLVVGWSYEEPVSPGNIEALDLETLSWLDSTLYEVMGLRSLMEKKGFKVDSSGGRLALVDSRTR